MQKQTNEQTESRKMEKMNKRTTQHTFSIGTQKIHAVTYRRNERKLKDRTNRMEGAEKKRSAHIQE